MVTHTQTEKGLLQETTCSIDFKPWSRNVQNKCSQEGYSTNNAYQCVSQPSFANSQRAYFYDPSRVHLA